MLFKTGYGVFVAILQSCQKEKLTDGLANTVDLICFDGELNGDALGMTDRTFHNRLKELISKGFLKPKLFNQYWINPALFLRDIELPLCVDIAKHQRTNK